MKRMPKINLNQLKGEALQYAKTITRKDGTLRATKPTTCGKAAYVWRIVAFYISPKGQHQCMPVTAHFGIPGDWDEREQAIKHLDAIIDEIMTAVDKTEWHGLRRWANALYR